MTEPYGKSATTKAKSNISQSLSGSKSQIMPGHLTAPQNPGSSRCPRDRITWSHEVTELLLDVAKKELAEKISKHEFRISCVKWET